MSGNGPGILDTVFRGVLAKRWWVVAFYVLLLVPAAFLATRVGQDNTLDRLFIQDDPRFIATKDYEKVFGGGDYVVLFVEAKDTFSPEVLTAFDTLEGQLAQIPKVTPNTATAIFKKAKGGFDPKTQAADFKAFITGSKIFTDQGLLGPGFLSIACVIDAKTPAERNGALESIDKLIVPRLASPAPFEAIRRVGAPYVTRELDTATTQAGYKSFPVFALFVTLLCLGLYRSVRALGAIMISLGVNVGLTMGYIGLIGGTLSMVSAVVPMTVLITCTSTLVYLHSRYVDRPADMSVHEHHVFSMKNKFLACTASIFATAVGFLALLVSKIGPVREMGHWAAVGVAITWVVAFTLFPALQAILKCPTQAEKPTAGAFFDRFAEVLPELSYRWRWPLVSVTLALSAAGIVAIFGIPGVWGPMLIETNAVEHLDSDSDVYKDTARVEQFMPGLAVTNLWLVGKVGSLNQPDIIAGLDHFHTALEHANRVGSVVSPMTMLRSLQYIRGKGDAIPSDPDELEELTDSLETLVNADPLLGRFIEKKNMAQTQFTILANTYTFEDQATLEDGINAAWAETVTKDPALKEFELRIVGTAPLQTGMAHSLVPTLLESFVLTFVIIFLTFLVVFRSGPARIMAIIPSLFAIAVMFLFMRLTGVMLNAATILLASTVLGTSENDQIHFFYHFQERQKESTTAGLKHAVRVAMRPIFYATLINAGGFLSFMLAKLPPMSQFGGLGALAFVLSMIADFTALPAALWMVFRDKPESMK